MPRNGEGGHEPPDIWDNEGFGALEELRRNQSASADLQPPLPERPYFCPAAWFGLKVPEREWIVQDVIPSRVVTMLSGDGGLGKSLLSLQLAMACATEEPWIGLKAKQCKVLIVACEDEPDELHRRMHSVIQNSPLTFEHLLDIRIIPGAGYDNVLVDFSDPTAHGRRTEFCDFIQWHAEDFGAQLVILDSLHDFFDGNENLRPQARQFINHLRAIAMEIDGAVLLLAHPSLSGLSSGSGTSGNTAWNNTVRSRLYLTKPKEDNATHLVLKTMKANYGPSGGEIRIEWRAGAFYNLDTSNHNHEPVYVQVQVDDVFLTCLRAIAAQGRHVTDSKMGRYAPKVFAAMKDLSRSYGIKEFEAAMQRLFADGRIKMDGIKMPNRTTREGLVECGQPPKPDGTYDDDLT